MEGSVWKWTASFTWRERERVGQRQSNNLIVVACIICCPCNHGKFTQQPTGKQLFLSNKAGLEELLLAAAEAEEAAGGAIAISEELFIGEALPDDFEEYDSANDSDYVAEDGSEADIEDEDFDD